MTKTADDLLNILLASSNDDEPAHTRQQQVQQLTMTLIDGSAIIETMSGELVTTHNGSALPATVDQVRCPRSCDDVTLV